MPDSADTPSADRIDPVTLEVIDNRIDEVVREMQHVMFRTGYSTIIRDSKDGSAGFCLPDGRVIGQAFRLPLHCGVFPPTIEAIYRDFDREEIRPGDTFVMNDPYRSGANHTPDLMVATPAFYDGELQGFCCTIAHKPDMGGIAPGSMSADAREIYHEGMLIPPVKYRIGGELNDTVERIIRNNSRTPEITMGDVRGQVGSTDIGVENLKTLLDDYGAETIQQAAEQLLEATSAELAETVRPWNGTATVSGTIDNDVTSDEPITIRLTVRTTEGDPTLTFDFEGTDSQSDGPSNIQPHVARSACLNGVVGIIDPELPLNSGIADLCQFEFPERSVVNPSHPAPCGNYAKGMCVIDHLALRALSEFAPELGVAETGNKASITVDHSGADTEGEDVVHFEIMGSGYGGNRENDGASCMATSYESNVRFTPIEIVETEYPMRFAAFEPRADSAGPGRRRGGVGFRREYEALFPSDVTYSGSNHDTKPKGVAGGRDAPTGNCRRLDADGDVVEELETIQRLTLDAGERLQINRPGGAGYGDPTAREPEKVLEDVKEGLVTLEAAREQYAVEIISTSDGYQIDSQTTAELRDN
jgi:N-methylhydantoinase B